jgi:hypothetical protein
MITRGCMLMRKRTCTHVCTIAFTGSLLTLVNTPALFHVINECRDDDKHYGQYETNRSQ